MKHVLIHGPQACGKSRNRHRLAEAFNCQAIEDGYTLSQIVSLANHAKKRTLFLTCEPVDPTQHFAVFRRAEVYAYGDAMGRVAL